ncbi:MAG: T9SS type A sorting domain-containing protein [Cryomorphaceae bacterium]|nr:T9SS type A sorting domain-containing protein [Cryomorphaceae bacterium]
MHTSLCFICELASHENSAMKNILLFSFLSLSAVALAQPVITAADLTPTPGTNQIGDSVMFVDVSGMTGPNQTWDLSDLTPIGPSYNYSWINPNSGPGAANFSGANAAMTVEIVSFYSKISSDKYESVGYYINVDGTEVIETYSNPSTRFGLPLSYNASGNDTYASTTSFGGLFDITSSGSTNWNVVGYGTLNLPTGSFNNVLLVHVVDSSEDTQSFGGIEISTNITDDVYLFYKAGYPLPLAVFETITITDITGSETTQGGLVFSITVDVDDLSNTNKISIYPNPTSDVLTVSFNNMQPYRLDVVSLTGEVVKTIRVNNLQNELIDVSDLSEGMYIIRAVGEKGTIVDRFMKL